MLVALTALATTVGMAWGDESVPASGYVAVRGEQFFLLADRAFASDEPAQVRLEAPGRDYRRFAMEGYGGVDIRLYRIERPLDYLKQQRNLHRIRHEGRFRGEGLSNTLAYLWDNWYRGSRRAMQRAFSAEARKTLTEQAPELSMGEALRAPTRFAQQPRYEPIPGLPLVAQFRYPIWEAAPIQPPAGVELAGSSSHFIQPSPGNVHVPLGTLAPGLYLVEAIVGEFRATTAVFVSDTVAVTKTASGEMLVWAANKHDGAPVADAQLVWTDGLGVLASGRSDGDGLLRLARASPERSYLIGEDPQGGVFVSENFYYDSEIHSTKLYAFTDRPLYRPGDQVELRVLGREFLNARDSVAVEADALHLAVIDASGTLLQSETVAFDGEAGASARFRLPDNAVAGGYELRMQYRDQVHSSAFRVAEYIRPHFEIVLDLDEREPRTGTPVHGELTLLYPDGKPVAGAHVQIGLRAQQLTMVDHELQYLGQFPVDLSATELVTDARGKAKLALPAAERPSRYLLTVFASDGAAYRVRTTKEILIERGAARYRVEAARRFSAAGEQVVFRWQVDSPVADGLAQAPSAASANAAEATAADAAAQPVRYEWLRLEDRSSGGGGLDAGVGELALSFERPGTYNLMLKNAHGMILGATGHAVSGSGVVASAGSIEIVFDKPEYRTGEVAEALITFPEPVSEALLTLERDRVEHHALLSRGGEWLTRERLNDTQYRVRIPVSEAFAPNLTFSALYTRGSDYSFQNAGIKVARPAIDIAIRTDREVYLPGDTATVTLETRLDGEPVSARLVVGVVDEMIYALQPEIAPSIGEFFHHIRRNNVRTSASLAFIGYDMAVPPAGAPPGGARRSERGVKVLERPRRAEVDTAAWQPDLHTGPDGKAVFTFTVPDSLTRWRITARAIETGGMVGQRRHFVRSDKPLYLKWSGPTRFRAGDAPALGVLAFNQQDEAQQVDLVVATAGSEQRLPLQLPRGASHVALPAMDGARGEWQLRVEREGTVMDALAVTLEAEDAGWRALGSRTLALQSVRTELALPGDASELRLRLAQGPEGLLRSVLDDLLEYPYGCVEQTASRLLPLALAYPALAERDGRVRDRLRLTLMNSRLRLVHMAGPEAHFGWWGEAAAPDPLLTAYAYLADWHASRALGLTLPPGHWARALDIYAERADDMPLLHRALVLDFADAAGQPVATLVSGLVDAFVAEQAGLLAAADEAFAAAPPGEVPPGLGERDGLVLEAPDSPNGRAVAWVLAARLAEAHDVPLSPGFQAGLRQAQALVARGDSVFVEAAALYTGTANNLAKAAQVGALFARLAPEQATLERAVTLAWLHGRLPAADGTVADSEALRPADPNWTPETTPSGETRWLWRGDTLPDVLALAAEPSGPLQARIEFRSETAPSALPVEIERRLWRLAPGQEAFVFGVSEVARDVARNVAGDERGGSVVSSSSLYLDEIVVRRRAAADGDAGRAARPLRYGVLEVPLPPGADVERTTWGLQISGLGGTEAAALERARHEPGNFGYTVPIDTLDGELRLRHLVRFSQKGEFQLPPARYWRMYLPDDQAWERDPALARLKVE
ncbi:MAG: alpha-2-macroglobulin family protein [Rhodocyclaceae bacterium]